MTKVTSIHAHYREPMEYKYFICDSKEDYDAVYDLGKVEHCFTILDLCGRFSLRRRFRGRFRQRRHPSPQVGGDRLHAFHELILVHDGVLLIAHCFPASSLRQMTLGGLAAVYWKPYRMTALSPCCWMPAALGTRPLFSG